MILLLTSMWTTLVPFCLYPENVSFNRARFHAGSGSFETALSAEQPLRTRASSIHIEAVATTGLPSQIAIPYPEFHESDRLVTV